MDGDFLHISGSGKWIFGPRELRLVKEMKWLFLIPEIQLDWKQLFMVTFLTGDCKWCHEIQLTICTACVLNIDYHNQGAAFMAGCLQGVDEPELYSH